jgi:hypothetical protein
MRDTANPAPVQHRALSVGSIVACPDPGCVQVAEIIAAWTWPSTSGAVAHVRTRCLARHVFTPRLESIVAVADPVVADSASRVASHA